jgi:ankyrin repeat protein
MGEYMSPMTREQLLALSAAQINRTNADGYTILMWAAKRGDSNLVRVLLEHPGIDVNFRTDDGSAVLFAIAEGYMEIARLLLDRPEIDVNHMDGECNVPLLMAVNEEDIPMVKLLLDTKKIDWNFESQDLHALGRSYDSSNLEMFELLLANGANPNSFYYNDETTLHLYLLFGGEEEAVFLRSALAAGLYISAKDAEDDDSSSLPSKAYSSFFTSLFACSRTYSGDVVADAKLALLNELPMDVLAIVSDFINGEVLNSRFSDTMNVIQKLRLVAENDTLNDTESDIDQTNSLKRTRETDEEPATSSKFIRIEEGGDPDDTSSSDRGDTSLTVGSIMIPDFVEVEESVLTGQSITTGEL